MSLVESVVKAIVDEEYILRETITDSSSNNGASSTSTPPTSLDSASLASEGSKAENLTPATEHDEIVADTIIHAIAEALPPSTPIRPSPSRQEQDDAKPDVDIEIHGDSQPPSTTRARRARVGVPTYNLARLSGTFVHGWRRAKGDVVSNRRRGPRHQSASEAGMEFDDSLAHDIASQSSVLNDGSNAESTTPNTRTKTTDSDLDASVLRRLSKKPNSLQTRRVTQASPPKNTTGLRSSSRRSRASFEALAPKASPISKRNGRPTPKVAERKLPRELLRLRDTKEFAHLDEKPVYHTIWSNGKLVDERTLKAQQQKKDKAQQAKQEKPVKVEEAVETEAPKVKRVKKYHLKGLYAGQAAPRDVSTGLTTAEKKKLAQLPELLPSGRPNKVLPFPMFNGLRLLINGADFKLPYNICNPLPPGQPKPDEWRKMTKNRFIGDSLLYWKKSTYQSDLSKCICTKADGCGEDCQNRCMLYECDEGNCNVGKEFCTNRAFADLTERKAKGGKYRIGVEVLKTADRGYGVRANRCFEANQIIMEYTGEIITLDECDRRMNEEYKNNECYYLMSFDQNMIIDATTGSAARFVNHSCNPNCRMVKWIVKGEPRMALFAGDRPIMTGDELTYDYNFDPFSQKNVQKCLCGEENCRGVLGPKPKDAKPAKVEAKAAKKTKATKRKLNQALEDDDVDEKPSKKRKVATAKTSKKTVKSTTVTTKARAMSKAMARKPTGKAAKPTARTVVKKESVTVSRARKVAGRTVVKKETVTVSRAKVAPKRVIKPTAKVLKNQAMGAVAKGSPRAKGKLASKATGRAASTKSAKSQGVKRAVNSSKRITKAVVRSTARSAVKQEEKIIKTTTIKKVVKKTVGSARADSSAEEPATSSFRRKTTVARKSDSLVKPTRSARAVQVEDGDVYVPASPRKLATLLPKPASPTAATSEPTMTQEESGDRPVPDPSTFLRVLKLDIGKGLSNPGKGLSPKPNTKVPLSGIHGKGLKKVPRSPVKFVSQRKAMAARQSFNASGSRQDVDEEEHKRDSSLENMPAVAPEALMEERMALDDEEPVGGSAPVASLLEVTA